MMRHMTLSSKQYWESVNARDRARPCFENGFFSSPIPAIFNDITDRFFISDGNKKIIEIGCAPGHKLTQFAARYGYEPYGVEYTALGADATRKTFMRHHIPPEHVFLKDFFDADFQRAHRYAFDVVMSFGFIEHFYDPRSALAAHVDMLRPGGLLLIMIPNIRGIYYPLLRFLEPHVLAIHNTEIMKKKIFQNLFQSIGMQELFCDYYGLLNFGLLQARGNFRTALLKMLWRMQSLINPVMSFFYHPLLENRTTSPYLLYIGRKE